MERIWNDINDEMKEGIYQHFVEEWGAVHGQQVVVEARLVHHLIYFDVFGIIHSRVYALTNVHFMYLSLSCNNHT